MHVGSRASRLFAIIMTGALMPLSAATAKAEPEFADAPGSAMGTAVSDELAPSTTEAAFEEPENASLEPGAEEPAIEEPASTPSEPHNPPRDGHPLDIEAPPPAARGTTTYRWAGTGELERRRNAFAITWGVGTAGMIAGIGSIAYGMQECGFFPSRDCSRGQKAAVNVGAGLGLVATAAAITGLVGFIVTSSHLKRQRQARVSTNLGGLTVRF